MIIVTLIKQTNNYFDEKQSTESREVNNQIWILTISLLWSLISDTSINSIARKDFKWRNVKIRITNYIMSRSI